MKTLVTIFLLAATSVMASEEMIAQWRAISAEVVLPKPYGLTSVRAEVSPGSSETSSKIQKLTFVSEQGAVELPLQIFTGIEYPQIGDLRVTYSGGDNKLYVSISFPFGEAVHNTTMVWRKISLTIVENKPAFYILYTPKDDWYETELKRLD